MFVRNRQPMLSAPLLGGGFLLGADQALAEYGLNMTPGATEISREVFDLHMWILWICVWIGVVVFGAIFVSVLRHRKSRGTVAAQFHESTAVEIVWTIVPFLILIAIAVPATQTLLKMEDVSKSDITIKVTGFQWKWRYDYLDQNIGFFSALSTPRDQIDNMAPKGEHYLLEVDHPLVVPVGKKIRFLVTANDVIHSWWVPDLAIKKDGIPGFINEVWTRIDKPGVYRGQCAELCGKDHGFMPIVVEAKSEADFQTWVAEQQAIAAAAVEDPNKVWTYDESMAKGEKVYAATCAVCHQASGLGVPGAFPALKGGQITTGPIAGHLQIVIHGKPGTAMQAFGTQLSDSELAAVITYERNAWGNNTGDTVQPSQVKAAR